MLSPRTHVSIKKEMAVSLFHFLFLRGLLSINAVGTEKKSERTKCSLLLVQMNDLA